MTKPSALIEAEGSVAAALPFLGALGWAPIIAECSWIVDELDDVESDLSAFHRIDDYRTMTSARFFALALRLGAYSGVVQAREVARREEERGERPQSTPGRTAAAKIKHEASAFAELEADGLLEREVA